MIADDRTAAGARACASRSGTARAGTTAGAPLQDTFDITGRVERRWYATYNHDLRRRLRGGQRTPPDRVRLPPRRQHQLLGVGRVAPGSRTSVTECSMGVQRLLPLGEARPDPRHEQDRLHRHCSQPAPGTARWPSGTATPTPGRQERHRPRVATTSSGQAIDMTVVRGGPNAGEVVAAYGTGQRHPVRDLPDERPHARLERRQHRRHARRRQQPQWLRLAADPGDGDLVLGIETVDRARSGPSRTTATRAPGAR